MSLDRGPAQGATIRYLVYSEHGIEYLARIQVVAQVQVTWQYEADPPHIPGEPGTLEDLAAQGYVAVTDLAGVVVADGLEEMVDRYWLTAAEAAQVRPPDEDAQRTH